MDIEEIGDFIALMDKPLYKSIAASIVHSGLSLSDLLVLKYGDMKEEFEKGITPICLSLTRKKTGIAFITFMGSWSVKLLKNYLANLKLDDEARIYDVSARDVHTYFRKVAERFMSNLKGRNPYGAHSLRAAFRTFLSDHKVDPLYIEYWMGHAMPEQQSAYINKSRESWRQTYKEQAEPWLTPPLCQKASFSSDSNIAPVIKYFMKPIMPVRRRNCSKFPHSLSSTITQPPSQGFPPLKNGMQVLKTSMVLEL